MIARRSVACGPPLTSSGSTKFERPRNASVSKGARTSWTRGVRRKSGGHGATCFQRYLFAARGRLPAELRKVNIIIQTKTVSE